LMGQPKVKAALGVPIDTPYHGLSLEVLDKWTRNGDLFRPSHMLVNELLDKVHFFYSPFVRSPACCVHHPLMHSWPNLTGYTGSFLCWRQGLPCYRSRHASAS
jgi:hypothetical protein